MQDVFVALGSNLDQPRQQVLTACEVLKGLPDCQWQGRSSLYQSAAIGPGSNDYINAVCHLKTSLSAKAFFQQLQNTEQQLGRTKKERWGDRSIDLDLVLYGQQIIDYPFLRVPHPQFLLRNFVLLPLLELVPDLILPWGTPLGALLKNTSTDGLSKLDD